MRSRRLVRMDARDEGDRHDRLSRVLSRSGSIKARAARPRHRPDVLIPRGFLPLVVH
ncbi:MAG TPA: hypothetical protein PLW68_06110 [Casimicrobiaceae bacterium]|nr:hypothetical protein [Casimicrobiaceae bacterium]